MNPTGRAGDLDLSIKLLQTGRIYKSNAVMGAAIIKYIGTDHVVYDYYTEMEQLFNQGRPAECTKLIKEFKDTYTATPFMYDPEEV